MHRIPYADLKRGTFLIASPEINEGLFFRSVVLLCDHSPVGSFGIVVNKPVDVDIPDDIMNLEELSGAKIDIRAGGPNQQSQIMLLHSVDQPSDSNLNVCPGVNLGGDLECLQEMDETKKTDLSLLLCLGYSGWGAGLLEREFLSGAWFVHPASSSHVFETPSHLLWQTILREMGGKYKTLSMMPEDLELN